MRYVGNTALSPQIQERIQNTFEQTVGLAEEGNRQEALLGCDFILRLDPLFEPARTLMERLNEGEGPVDVSNLEGAESAPAPEAAVPPAPEIPEASVDIGELLADAPDEDPLVGDAPVEVAPQALDAPPIDLTEDAPPIAMTPMDELSPDMALEDAPEAAAPMGADVATRMAMLFEQRSFDELMSLAMENKEMIAKDASLMELVDSATERMEAEPYVRNFLESAQVGKEKGDLESAATHLEKARELDPSHPDIARLEADLEATAKVEPPAAFEPPPMLEVSLDDVPPLLDSDETGDLDAEVKELFAEVETPTAEIETPAPTTPEPETHVAEAPPIPSLDAEPSARLDSESEQRIDELLKEGQESFEVGQYQAAIDAWSRIFLIDIDHAEASRRIELARKLKAEVERQIEEAFHDGITQLESGDKDMAKEGFDKVLEMQPNHMGARDYLDKMESGDLSAAAPAAPELAPVLETPADLDTAPEPALDADLTPTPSIPRRPMPDDIAPDLAEPPPKPAPRKRSFALIGTAVLIVVLAIGWFVYSKWDQFFPASGPEDDAAVVQQRADPIERARDLHEAGNTAMAINILRRLPPSNDQYAEAQALIANWEAGDQEDDAVSDAPSEEHLARRVDLLLLAEQAAARGENLVAMDFLERAHAIVELTEEEAELQAQAGDALELLQTERDLFEQGDWEYALPSLWRMHDADPENRDVLRLMVDSYYNLGLRDLQRGDANTALEKFEEAQSLSEGDESLDRLAHFATAYSQRPSDMLYRIFVKYQRFR